MDSLASDDALYQRLLARTATYAVRLQCLDYAHLAIRAATRPAKRWEVLLRRTPSMRVWRLPNSPIDGLCLGEDEALYWLNEFTPTPSVIPFDPTYCTPDDVRKITDVLLDMGTPANTY